MAFPSQTELVNAIQQLKSYVEVSDDGYSLIHTAALLLNISATNNVADVGTGVAFTTYPGDIEQTIYVDSANGNVPVLYSKKYDSLISTYVTYVYTLTGAVYTPINPPTYILPSSVSNESNYGVIEISYEALLTTAQFTVGDQLNKITSFINGVSNPPVWINDTTGVVLITPPVLPTEARPTSDYANSLLDLIKVNSDSILTNIASVNTNTNTLSADLTSLITNTDNLITVLNTISSTETTGNTKLDSLITSLGNVGTSATSIDTKLNNLSTVTSTTTALATKLEDIKTQLTNLQSSLITLNSLTTSNNLVVTNIDTNIGDISTELTTLSNKFTFQSGILLTDSSATTQPVSAASLPLPTGAATQTTLALVKTNTDKLDVNLSTIPDTLAKENGGNLDAINTKLPILTTTANGLKVDGSAVTQPVSVTSLPLPSGAATAVNQLDSIALETTIDSNINIIKNKLATGTLLVDGSATTQPISVTSLPLPTDAANQTTLSSIDTNIDTLVNVDFSTAAAQSTTNTRLQTIINTLPDLSTTALQTAGNDSLTSIDGKLSALATSSKQDTNNTLLTAISNKDFATEASLAAIKDAVLGNVNISESIWTDDSGTFFVRKIAFNEDVNAEVVSFKLFDGVTTYIPSTNPKPADTTLNITQPLTDTQLRASAVPVFGSFYPSIQDVNVSSLPLPTGAAISTLQTAGNIILTDIKTNLDSIVADVNNISNNSVDIITNTAVITDTNTKLDTVNTKLDTVNTSVSTVNTSVGTTNTTLSTINNKVPTGLTVTANKLIVDGSSVTQPISGTVDTGLSQPLTDIELRASAIAVSGTFYPATQPVSVTTLPLPTGAATDASLSTINTSVGSVKTSTDNLLTPINNIDTKLDSVVTSNSSIDTKLPSGLTVTSNKLIVDNSSVIQPVSGTVTVSNFVASLTDAELRATPVPVTMMSANTDIETVLLAINSVASVNIFNGGSGYINGSGVTFTGGTAIVAASGVIITSTTGAVIGIDVTTVGQYTVNPTGFIIAGAGLNCTGAIAMGSTVQLVTDNLSTIRGYISNESVDNVSFEISLDGYNWIVSEVLNTANNAVINTATSGDYPLSFVANVSGTDKFRIRRTSITNSNTPRVFLNSSSDIAYIKTQTISSSTSGGLTDAQLRASPLALPTGAATTAAQNTGNTTLSTINGKLPALGQALAAASTPVVLTAAQLSTLTPLTTVATTQSGGWTVTANTGLTQPLTDTQLRASAVPVSGTFFQATQPINATALPLPSGASTSALQTTGNNSLSSIDSKTPLLGQALITTSVPVVLPATQLTTLTPLTSVGRTWNLNSTTDGIAIGGTLPAFASTPTFNIGTAPTLNVTGTVNVSTLPPSVVDDIVNIRSNTARITLQKNEYIAVTTVAFSWTIGDILTRLLTLNASGSTIAAPIWQNAQGGTLATAPVIDVDVVETDAQQINLLKSIDTKTPVLGQALAASSVPVVLTAAQITTLTPPATITGFALNSTLTGGTAKSIIRSGVKGITTAADVTSTASGVNRQPLDVIIYDTAGNAITTFGGGGGGTQYVDATTVATPTGTQINWNGAGTQKSVSLTQSFPVQPGTGVTFPVSLTTLPSLPTGSNVIGSISNTTFGAAQSGTWNVTNISGTVSLPTGAATSTLQTAGNASLTSIDTKLTTNAVGLVISGGDSTGVINSGRVLTVQSAGAGSPAQPITGGVTATLQTSLKGSTASGSITSTNQGADRQGLDVQIRTSAGVAIDSFGGGIQYADGVARSTATGTLAMGDDGINIQSVKVDTAGVLAIQDNGGSITIDAATLPLPTGASTSALQTTISNTLTSIDAGIPVALGSTVSASSMPVVIATDQGIINSCSQTNTYQPNPQGISKFAAPLILDDSGRLETHSAVYTDEGSFRDDFSVPSLLTTLIGTVNFVNNSAVITGTGTAFSIELKVGQYIKKTADANSALVQIDYIFSDTSLVLSEVYTGTTGTSTAQYSNWFINATGTGATASATSSLLNLVSGTDLNGTASLIRGGDCGPFSVAFNCSVSQRIANQTIILGLTDINSATPNVQATIQFTGTTNTVCTFVTSSTSSISDTQSTTVTLPNGALTSSTNTYKIDVSNNRCTLVINGIVCAVNDIHIPQPYDLLSHLLKVVNSAVVTSTTVAIDYYYFENVNRIQVDNDFQGEPQRVSLTGRTTTGLTTDLLVDTLNYLPVSNSDKQKATYSVSFSKVAGVVTAATDYLTLTGSATKTIRIQKINYTAYSTTANTLVPVTLLLRSTVNAGGTTVSRAAIKHDQNSPNPTAACNTYTVNPTTPGVLIGSIRQDAVLSILGTSGTNVTGMNHVRVHDFTTGGQEIVLRGTSQSLSLNLNGASIAGVSFTVEIQYTEE
jgi:hypothetical protein